MCMHVCRWRPTAAGAGRRTPRRRVWNVHSRPVFALSLMIPRENALGKGVGAFQKIFRTADLLPRPPRRRTRLYWRGDSLRGRLVSSRENGQSRPRLHSKTIHQRAITRCETRARWRFPFGAANGWRRKQSERDAGVAESGASGRQLEKESYDNRPARSRLGKSMNEGDPGGPGGPGIRHVVAS